jgi:predicted 2-oxoglutarate/Fe(II)-dependent dioxygenase YbiX
MANSFPKRKAIVNRKRSITKNIKRLQKLQQKVQANARIVRLKNIKLGALRKNYTPHHKEIPQNLLKDVSTFRRIRSDPKHPLFIYGADGGLLAYRGHLNNSQILKDLTSSLAKLPRRTNLKFRGIDRGSYSTRHYCTWSPYSKRPFVSKELQEDGEAGLEFLKANTGLWKRLSNILGQISPGTYRQFLRYPLPKNSPRFCSAWAGCVVNLGDKDPVQTKLHRDVKESKFGFSCVVPAGNYIGGALILYDLRLVIELTPGEVFLFPDSLIHHANEDISGERSSIVAFTQENLFHYWARKYKYINNKDKSKSKSRKKESEIYFKQVGE